MNFHYTDGEIKQIAEGYVDETMPNFGKYIQVDSSYDTKFYPLDSMFDDDDITSVSIVSGWGVEYTDEFGMSAVEVFDTIEQAVAFSNKQDMENN